MKIKINANPEIIVNDYTDTLIEYLKNKHDGKQLDDFHFLTLTLRYPDLTLIFKDQGKEIKREHAKAFEFR
ncbi:hypothetical protein E5D82_02305 [Helicobacter pylori]|nr:hypothetical protein E5D82_02305 [Helicobacter pylori]